MAIRYAQLLLVFSPSTEELLNILSRASWLHACVVQWNLSLSGADDYIASVEIHIVHAFQCKVNMCTSLRLKSTAECIVSSGILGEGPVTKFLFMLMSDDIAIK